MEDRIFSLENKLDSLAKQVAELERRLGILERASGRSTPLRPFEQPARTNYRYLNRTIAAARREYERQSGSTK